MKTKSFVKINRDYVFTSAELRKAFDIEGRITNVSLWNGHPPLQSNNPEVVEGDEWLIQTEEIKPTKKGGCKNFSSPS